MSSSPWWGLPRYLVSYQFSSVTQSCPILCDSMDCSTPGLPVHHQLLEFTQTHVHWVSEPLSRWIHWVSHPTIHPLLSPSLLAFYLSQHQGLFQWVRSSHQVAKGLELCISFSISPSNEYSGLISFRMDCLISLWILVPWPGVESVPSTLEAQGLNHWTARKVPKYNRFRIGINIWHD